MVKTRLERLGHLGVKRTLLQKSPHSQSVACDSAYYINTNILFSNIENKK